VDISETADDRLKPVTGGLKKYGDWFQPFTEIAKNND
jgi:hypothetical protein